MLPLLSVTEDFLSAAGNLRGKQGQELRIPCPGLNDTALVKRLDWWCFGCGPPPVMGGRGTLGSRLTPRRLAHVYEGKSKTFAHWAMDRMSIRPKVLSLQLDTAILSDSGKYLCDVNGNRGADGFVNVKIQGEFMSAFFSLSTGYQQKIKKQATLFQSFCLPLK